MPPHHYGLYTLQDRRHHDGGIGMNTLVLYCWNTIMTQQSTNPLIGSPNRFKLGIFSANADGGLTLTRVPERWPAKWNEIVQVAQIADQAGIELFLPIARWKGFGGEMNSREVCYETLTFASALASATRNIALCATVHTPMVHPVFAAKALATLDQASAGRACLNVVCGWNPEEFALFGLPMIEDRYAQGDEWMQVVSHILSGAPPIDFDGTYYKLRNVSGRPLSVQRPRPVTLNAAFSPPGREFAVNHADFLFTTFSSIEDGMKQVEDMRARSKGRRDVGVFTTCHVVCRPTRSEAEEYYQYYAVTMEDTESCDHYMASKAKNSGSHDAEVYRLHRKRFAGGGGTYPLIGTPDMIADEMLRMAECGFAGTALSFVNYLNELPYFVEHVLPRLQRYGLRV